jgi:Zn-dependent protease
MNFFITTLYSNPPYFFATILAVVFSICCHEYAHARVALWQGDPTAAEEGHLTLNPLKQMGFMSIIMLAIIGIAWGMVPVNPARMKHRYSDVLVSLAGPAMNLLLFFSFCILLAGALKLQVPQMGQLLFYQGARLNLVLMTFNLLPIPGLDGWHVANSLFPNLKHKMNSEIAKGTYLILIILAFLFIKYLFIAAEYATLFLANWLYSAINYLTGLL